MLLSKQERDELVSNNLHLVNKAVNRLSQYTLPTHISKEDLRSIGTLSLIECADTCTLENKVKFHTFARLRIYGAIIDTLRSYGHKSASLKMKAKKYDDDISLLNHSLGRDSLAQERADYLNITLDDLYKLEQDIIPCQDECYDDIELKQAINFIEPDLDRELMHKELLEELERRINTFTPKEKLVFTLYYYERLSFNEIGILLDNCIKTIRSIHRSYMNKLLLKEDDFGKEYY